MGCILQQTHALAPVSMVPAPQDLVFATGTGKDQLVTPPNVTHCVKQALHASRGTNVCARPVTKELTVRLPFVSPHATPTTLYRVVTLISAVVYPPSGRDQRATPACVTRHVLALLYAMMMEPVAAWQDTLAQIVVRWTRGSQMNPGHLHFRSPFPLHVEGLCAPPPTGTGCHFRLSVGSRTLSLSTVLPWVLLVLLPSWFSKTLLGLN